MKIDAHQHFWNPVRGDYGWMSKESKILHKSYLPNDLKPYLLKSGIDKTVLVQAAPSIEETEYLLGLADSSPFVAGVVGWINFEKVTDITTLRRLSKHPKFVGVRPMVQDIPDDDWILRDDIQWAFEAIIELDLTFDALGFPKHIENFKKCLLKHKEMRAVIDHFMKPQIEKRSYDSFKFWADGISSLAEETSTYIKFSGLLTEASEDWTIDDLRPYVEHILNTFGAKRILWGSDWPVCCLRADYEAWYAAASELTNGLSSEDKADLFGNTAIKAYKLFV
tara:strand:- start:192 stop:1031 length:840 start_codon:yes stop_codon:yes gene_type:complete